MSLPELSITYSVDLYVSNLSEVPTTTSIADILNARTNNTSTFVDTFRREALAANFSDTELISLFSALLIFVRISGSEITVLPTLTTVRSPIVMLNTGSSVQNNTTIVAVISCSSVFALFLIVILIKRMSPIKPKINMVSDIEIVPMPSIAQTKRCVRRDVELGLHDYNSPNGQPQSHTVPLGSMARENINGITATSGVFVIVPKDTSWSRIANKAHFTKPRKGGMTEPYVHAAEYFSEGFQDEAVVKEKADVEFMKGSSVPQKSSKAQEKLRENSNDSSKKSLQEKVSESPSLSLINLKVQLPPIASLSKPPRHKKNLKIIGDGQNSFHMYPYVALASEEHD
jgi:hypothetical protein